MSSQYSMVSTLTTSPGSVRPQPDCFASAEAAHNRAVSFYLCETESGLIPAKVQANVVDCIAARQGEHISRLIAR